LARVGRACGGGAERIDEDVEALRDVCVGRKDEGAWLSLDRLRCEPPEGDIACSEWGGAGSGECSGMPLGTACSPSATSATLPAHCITRSRPPPDGLRASDAGADAGVASSAAALTPSPGNAVPLERERMLSLDAASELLRSGGMSAGPRVEADCDEEPA